MTENAKLEILKVTDALIVERGGSFRDVTIDEICHELGISKKTFYQYYSQKEELISDVVGFRHDTQSAALTELVSGKNVVQTLKLVINYIVRHKTLSDEQVRLHKELEKYYPKVFQTQMQRQRDQLKAELLQYIGTGQKEGLFRSEIEPLPTITLITMLHDGMMKYLSGKSARTLPGKSVVTSFMDIMLHTFLSESGWEEFRKNDIEN